MFSKKGQGALEYLLIIGAAVIIAVIVIAVIMGLTQSGTKATDDADIQGSFDAANLQLCEQKDYVYTFNDEETCAVKFPAHYAYYVDCKDCTSASVTTIVLTDNTPTTPTTVAIGTECTTAFDGTKTFADFPNYVPLDSTNCP